MKRRYLWVIAVAVAVLIVALVLAACGSSTTSTTAAPAGSSTTAGATATTAGTAVDAAALYAQDCAGCHKSLPGGSADDIKAVIQNGTGSMPGFTDKMNAEQIAALAAWVANGGK